ncbi:MAG TPA: hypothetical protein VM265_08040 [Sphingomicrobium sp.]|nr:hypothetical protein [Sphingomicrobium sp.]
MSSQRELTHPPHLQAGKLAFAELVTAFGGQVAAAAETGKSQQRISDYGHRNTGDFAPVDVIDCLEERTVGTAGAPHVTRWLARRRGMMLVPLPQLQPSGAWGCSLRRIAKEFGDVAGRVCEAIGNPDSPGEVTADEIRQHQLVRELDELAEQVARMRALAVHTIDAGG